MAVVISPNIKKERSFIDTNGNEVVPYTKQIIKKVEEEYTPPADQIQIEPPKQEDHVSTPSPLAQAVKEQVQAAIAESIKGVDIKKMVDEAIKEAFK